MINNDFTISLGGTDDEIENNLNTLIKYTYDRYKLDHNKLIEQYGEREGLGTYDFEVDDYDDSWDTEFQPYELNDGEEDDIYPILDSEENYIDDPEYNLDLVEQMDHFLEDHGPDDLVFANYNTMIMKNLNGVNSDARGVRAIDWKLTYYGTRYMYGNITYWEFIDHLFKCKSHKFDFWYELYCGVEVEVEDKILKLSLGFDHGS